MSKLVDIYEEDDIIWTITASGRVSTFRVDVEGQVVPITLAQALSD